MCVHIKLLQSCIFIMLQNLHLIMSPALQAGSFLLAPSGKPSMYITGIRNIHLLIKKENESHCVYTFCFPFTLTPLFHVLCALGS